MIPARPLGLLAAVFLAVGANAADYPRGPVTLVVPFPPGGGTDVVARDLAQGLQERLVQSIVVDNRGGAGGAIGAQFVANARPDGQTILLITSTFTTHAAVETALPYDVRKSFAPVALLGRGPLMVVATPSLPAADLPALLALAKQRPGELNFCSAGPGSINHLAGEMFAQRAGVRLTHVPYKGSGPATVDLLAGRVQLFFSTVPNILGQVRSGKVRVVAMTGEKRSPMFPEVPTVAESGIAGYRVYTWWGVVAPAGTPAAVVAQLNAAVNEAAAADRLRRRFADEGAEPFRGPPADLGAQISSELDNWRAVVKQAGIQPEGKP